MKVTKWIEIEQEVEIDISAEDIRLILEDDGELREVLRNISRAATYLKAIPDKMIDEMNPAQKETIAKFLTGLIERLRPKAVE